jgi:hypothetical protein
VVAEKGAVAETVPKEFYKPCDMCGVWTTLRVNAGRKTSALCTPHAQQALAHLRTRGFNTITFSK